MSKQQRADALLILVTAFWGTSYYLSDYCMKELAPMNLNAFRFLSAFFLLSLVFHRDVFHAGRKTLHYSLLVGLALTATYILYGYGQPRTSISNAGFICGLPVIFTPIFDFLIHRHKPKRTFLFALFLCLIGICFLTLDESFEPAIGDIICLGVPICYSIDIVITETAVQDPEVNPRALGICQLAVVGSINLLLSCIIEQPSLPHTAGTWAAALFLGIFCSGIAFVMQSTQQQYTSASHVGLIFTFEPIFAAIVAFVFAGERMNARELFGASLMVISLLILEINPHDLTAFFKKRHQHT